MTAPWAAAAERGSLTGMRITAWFYRRFGRRLSAWFILPIVTYFFVTDGRGRRACRRYLERLVQVPGGRAAVGGAPGFRHCYRQYREFGLVVLDRLRSTTGADDVVIAWHGREHVLRLLEGRRGAIILGAHLGSFEALRALAGRDGIVVNVVMARRHSPRITTALRALNPALDLRVIELDPGTVDAVFRLKACVGRGELVAILADRLGTAPRARLLRAPFLGLPAPFPQGPFLLAAALACPVLVMVALRRDERTYEVFSEPLADGAPVPPRARPAYLEQLVHAYARRLEAYCLRAPYQWFNFYDFWSEDTLPPEARAS
jgi:predicted LPLAT superfamily acyltransferase